MPLRVFEVKHVPWSLSPDNKIQLHYCSWPELALHILNAWYCVVCGYYPNCLFGLSDDRSVTIIRVRKWLGSLHMFPFPTRGAGF